MCVISETPLIMVIVILQIFLSCLDKFVNFFLFFFFSLSFSFLIIRYFTVNLKTSADQGILEMSIM